MAASPMKRKPVKRRKTTLEAMVSDAMSSGCIITFASHSSGSVIEVFTLRRGKAVPQASKLCTDGDLAGTLLSIMCDVESNLNAAKETE